MSDKRFRNAKPIDHDIFGARRPTELAARIPKLKWPNVEQALKTSRHSFEMDSWALKTPKIEFPPDDEGKPTFAFDCALRIHHAK
jgi:hypothetical protein